MKLRCLAIDDEPLALELLEDNIRQVPYLELVKGFNSPMQAMQFLQMKDIDLVFIDIQMPGLTGIQFINSLPKKPMYILVTAYEKYALEGYSLDVVDYLLKPVSMDRFIKACNKAMELHQLRVEGRGHRAEGKGVGTGARYIFVNADYRQVKVEFSDITFIESLKDYLKIHLKSQKSALITRMSMKSIEEELPSSGFIRIHKSYIVSTDAITAVKKSSVFIGDHELPVGDLYREAVDALTRSSL